MRRIGILRFQHVVSTATCAYVERFFGRFFWAKHLVRLGRARDKRAELSRQGFRNVATIMPGSALLIILHPPRPFAPPSPPPSSSSPPLRKPQLPQPLRAIAPPQPRHQLCPTRRGHQEGTHTPRTETLKVRGSILRRICILRRRVRCSRCSLSLPCPPGPPRSKYEKRRRRP